MVGKQVANASISILELGGDVVAPGKAALASDRRRPIESLTALALFSTMYACCRRHGD